LNPNENTAMQPTPPLFLLLALTACLFEHTLASDLVLTGPYTAIQVSSDDSKYTGNDGLMIHEGDHLHDPCNNYTGIKFTTGNNEADGFLVVNDCQIVKCKKWTTSDGKFGGETEIFDIVEQDSEQAETTNAVQMLWTVREESSCACGENCYVGKFLHVESYEQYEMNECEPVGASPGSIPCVEIEVNETVVNGNETTLAPTIPGPSISEQVSDILTSSTDSLSNEAIAGIAAAVAFMLIMCCCCFRCRRNNNKKEIPGTDAEKTSEKKVIPGWESEKDKKKEEVTSKTATVLPVITNEKESASTGSVGTEDEDSQGDKSETKTKGSWFGRMRSSESASKTGPVEPKEALKEALTEEKATSNDIESAMSKKQPKSKPQQQEGIEKDETSKNDTTVPEGTTEEVEVTCCGF